MDELIKQYAEELADIYENNTAGAYTFIGVLFHFSRDMLAVLDKSEDK